MDPVKQKTIDNIKLLRIIENLQQALRKTNNNLTAKDLVIKNLQREIKDL